MKTLEAIQRQLSLGEFDFSRHALKRVVERNIRELEIKEAGMNAKITEVNMFRCHVCGSTEEKKNTLMKYFRSIISLFW